MRVDLRLPPRLAAIWSLIPEGEGLADVGTDHGYLPVYAALTGRRGRIVASDIRRGPLEHAMASAREFGVWSRIEFRLCAGLDGVTPEGLGCVVLAGMGGETIRDILQAAPWTRAQGVFLVLQPQSKADVLSHWLDSAGYTVTDAKLAEDSGRIYPILQVTEGVRSGTGTDAQGFVEPLLRQRRDPLLGAYLAALIAKWEAAYAGAEQSAQTDPGVLCRLAALLRELRTMKEEAEQWSQ